jgi:hypothetical protein
VLIGNEIPVKSLQSKPTTYLAIEPMAPPKPTNKTDFINILGQDKLVGYLKQEIEKD